MSGPQWGKIHVLFLDSKVSLKTNLTEEQACSVMVKLHRAAEELPADRICSSFELWKKTQ